MKVLFVTNYGAMYGANRSMLNLILDLRERYMIEPIVLMPFEGDLKTHLEKLDIPCIACKHYIWAYENNFANGAKRQLYFLKSKALNMYYMQKLYRILAKEAIELVHSNTSITHAGALVANALGVPHIWHVREYGKLDYNAYFMYNRSYVNRLFSRAYSVIAISNSVKDYYEKKICPSASMRVVYNGVKDTYTGIHNRDVKVINFCCVGLLRDTKNQMEVLKAIAILAERRSEFIVHFIGDGNKDYIEKMKQYISNHHIEQYVKLWGYRNDVTDILKQMDIGLIPSLNEAFGRVTVEYMMESMPVIGANTGGTLELIEEGKTGYTYQVGNAGSLAEKMELYMNDIGYIETHGQEARKYAITHFSVERNTDNIYNIYEECMKEKEGM